MCHWYAVPEWSPVQSPIPPYLFCLTKKRPAPSAFAMVRSHVFLFIVSLILVAVCSGLRVGWHVCCEYGQGRSCGWLWDGYIWAGIRVPELRTAFSEGRSCRTAF